ncbi:uncharacterized protein E0L32_009915 [Thyridium curvatum]|uniref:Uncharacterized protein n=1 Tax=Thyridium curvatum TaxID=1093900 RepID=A0A507APD3_9PEZI|nr:uncharacterized protein E0L32_009915 [Thyridium curvatum]TPX08576.1 hypothetical protein E0L32_009915 [Thyridium curvatum]
MDCPTPCRNWELSGASRRFVPAWYSAIDRFVCCFSKRTVDGDVVRAGEDGGENAVHFELHLENPFMDGDILYDRFTIHMIPGILPGSRESYRRGELRIVAHHEGCQRPDINLACQLSRVPDRRFTLRDIWRALYERQLYRFHFFSRNGRMEGSRDWAIQAIYGLREALLIKDWVERTEPRSLYPPEFIVETIWGYLGLRYLSDPSQDPLVDPVGLGYFDYIRVMEAQQVYILAIEPPVPRFLSPLASTPKSRKQSIFYPVLNMPTAEWFLIEGQGIAVPHPLKRIPITTLTVLFTNHDSGAVTAENGRKNRVKLRALLDRPYEHGGLRYRSVVIAMEPTGARSSNRMGMGFIPGAVRISLGDPAGTTPGVPGTVYINRACMLPVREPEDPKAAQVALQDIIAAILRHKLDRFEFVQTKSGIHGRRDWVIHVLDVLSSTGKILTGVEGTVPFPNPLPQSTQSIMHFLGMRYLSEPRHGEAIPCPVRMGHFREYRRRSDASFPYDLDQMS